MTRAGALSGLGGAVLGAATPLSAHDLWLEPSTWTPELGQQVAIRIRVGEQFTGRPVARSPERTVRFAALTPSGERPLPGVAGGDPAAVLAIEVPGVHLVGFESRPAAISLEAEPFERYLVAEGLERIVAERARSGDSAAPARELFSRCALSLVAPGGLGEVAGVPRFGCPLELTVTRLAVGPAGGTLGARLLFRGRPLAGALVRALDRSAPRVERAARTDAGGRVELELDGRGPWLIKSVHMEAAESPDADWQSWWASLTLAGGRG